MLDEAETRRDELIAIFRGSSLSEDHKDFLVGYVNRHFRRPDIKAGLIDSLGDSLDGADDDAHYDELQRLIHAVYHLP